MNDYTLWFFLANYISCIFMTGVIWIVQVVHYPLYSLISLDSFARYQQEHIKKITPVVFLPMIIELITSNLLIFSADIGLSRLLIFTAAANILIWLSTLSFQIPLHSALTEGFDNKTFQKLLSSNWIRTLLWTLRTVLLSYILYKMLVLNFSGSN